MLGSRNLSRSRVCFPLMLRLSVVVDIVNIFQFYLRLTKYI